jgi:hypothetical protein
MGALLVPDSPQFQSKSGCSLEPGGRYDLLVAIALIGSRTHSANYSWLTKDKSRFHFRKADRAKGTENEALARS